MIQDKLLTLRRRAGMSQQEVADAIGVTRQTISNWELGQGAPALDKGSELARLYGVTLDDLASDEVDICSSERRGCRRDLHVLRVLVGEVVTIELADDDEAILKNVEVLDVSDGWVRVLEGRTIRLIDMADIVGIACEGRG